MWRSLALLSIAAGLIWSTTQPIWVIRYPEQVKIEGNERLSQETIRSLLPISYPQSLLTLRPQMIAQQLEDHGPIANAVVTRHLFPPELVIHIQERHPVAIAYLAAPDATAAAPVVLLDEAGNWLPMAGYTSLSQPLTLPNLKVIGMRHQYRNPWRTLYAAIQHSPIVVSAIDWRDPANLILTTDISVVQLGAYSSRINEQLRVLDQLRQLPSKINPKKIVFIDLKDPASPRIQTNSDSEQPASNPEAEDSSSNPSQH
jgi:cell division protein FtsQ